MNDDGLRFPTLYQINTRIVLREVGQTLGRPATLDDLPDSMIDEIAARGFSWVWLLGVWQTGEAARQVSRQDRRLRADLERELPGLRDEDIVGSPFAVTSYEVHRDFGGRDALARVRERLAARGLRLLLDFVPNHVAPDHPWIFEHPEYLIHGSPDDLQRQPQNFARFATRRGPAILAHGRDPYFDGWPDTVQLNYRHPGLREAQIEVLRRIAEQGDGVRCDMAMLLEPSVIARTWGQRAQPEDGVPPRDAPFWPEAITAVKRRRPGFLFIAEVYWDMEWTLQEEGFDFTYDKRLYDRLRDRQAPPVREHLQAAPAFRDRSLRFLENHDEPRAAAVFDPLLVHRAAAVVALTAPGLRLIHEGQIEGRRQHVSMHVGRRIDEPVDEGVRAFYHRLLGALARRELHDGQWQLRPCRPAWPGNATADQFIASSWQLGDSRLLAVVNYSGAQGQCYLPLDMPELTGRRWLLTDLLSETRYQREGQDLTGAGLYLDLPPWGYHLFDLLPG
jgi:hypothetical protein